MAYPRPGEPIVPRLLRPLMLERRPGPLLNDADRELIARFDLGADSWGRLSADTCRRLGLLVVDRVQTRLAALPALVLTTRLPRPEDALGLPLEPRTLNTIRRALQSPPAAGERPSGATSVGPVDPWTVERYLALRRFGGRALVDLLAAVEGRDSRAGAADREHAPGAGPAPAPDRYAGAPLDELLINVARQLPVAESKVSADLMARRLTNGPLDVEDLLRTAIRLGRNVTFRVIEIDGSRVVVRLSEVTAARAIYRIASRAVHGWGAATVRSVTTQLRTAADVVVGPALVERLLVALASFRWLDPRDGWFWFLHRSNPLLADLRKVLSVVSKISLGQLAAALFRGRVGPCPPLDALRTICASVPGTRIDRGFLTIDRPLESAVTLSVSENRIVQLMRSLSKQQGHDPRDGLGRGLHDDQLLRHARAAGLPRTAVWRLLRSSPLFERSPDGRLHLVGSA